MKTSYFSKIKNREDISICVSIALYTQRWWRRKIQEAQELAPGKAMLQRGYSYGDYVKLLKKRRLKPQAIYKKYKDCVLICHEKDNSGCHRRMVIRWLNENLGIEEPIEEIE